MALPKTTQERISNESKIYAKSHGRKEIGYYALNYISGATAENERAQALVAALELIIALTAAYRQGAAHSIFDLIDDIETNANSALQKWNAGKEAKFEGSIISEPAPGISLGCISPEARELLDTIMEHWEAHYKTVKTDTYEPTFYGFAYWLVRWSGLIQPTVKGTDRPCPHCGKELTRDRNLCCCECGKESEG